MPDPSVGRLNIHMMPDPAASSTQRNAGTSPGLASLAGFHSQSPNSPAPLKSASFLPSGAISSMTVAPSASSSLSKPSEASRSLSIGTSANQFFPSEDSPVLHQTLSVIDEHITNMNAPREVSSAGERLVIPDSASDYSNQPDHQPPYIPGHETDDEHQVRFTEAEILRWTPTQVAEHLQRIGVESRHCAVFLEQEISGEVLLGMDQQSLFIKEFDLGSIGRRLRTWQAIRAVQQDAKLATESPRALPSHPRSTFLNTSSSSSTTNTTTTTPTTTASSSAIPTSATSATRTRISALPTVLPRIPSMAADHRTSSYSFQPTQRPATSQGQELESFRPPAQLSNPLTSGARRPSAASVRDFNHSRRASSTDAGGTPKATDSPFTAGTSRVPTTPHKKQASFDRNWSMSAIRSPAGARPISATDGPASAGGLGQTISSGPPTPTNLDRGYFSQGEGDSRRSRNVLRKRDGVGHTRKSSYTEDHRQPLSASNFRHSRFGSADSIHNRATVAFSMPTSPAAQAYYGLTAKGKGRSHKSQTNNSPASLQGFTPVSPANDALSPIVTKLDSGVSGTAKASPPVRADVAERQGRQSSSSVTQRPILSWERGVRIRTAGPRVVSEAVTGGEKAHVESPAASLTSHARDSPVQSPTLTASSSPSGNKSFELESASEAAKTSATSVSRPGASLRHKSKKETSAYVRGLETKTPQEQMINCDYSGWMMKKSSNLMTTWKLRLFVLRGRRLSYYYTEKDNQERGVIDISSHRVLPADRDRITGLHATLTGVSASSSPKGTQTPTMASADVAQAARNSPGGGSGGSGSDATFIFKLVPPRAGHSRAVNFTKPTVHYFAVENVQVGRLWMAALMKATIARDHSSPVTMSYQAKTITLAKARQLRHRPPALMAPDTPDDSSDNNNKNGDEAREEGGGGGGEDDDSNSFVIVGRHRDQNASDDGKGLNIKAVNMERLLIDTSAPANPPGA